MKKNKERKLQLRRGDPPLGADRLNSPRQANDRYCLAGRPFRDADKMNNQKQKKNIQLPISNYQISGRQLFGYSGQFKKKLTALKRMESPENPGQSNKKEKRP